MGSVLKTAIRHLLPVNSKRRAVIRKVLKSSVPIDPTYSYDKWIAQNEPKLFEQDAPLKFKETISVVVPTYNTPDKYLYPLIESFTKQTYQNWQLCIADASTDIDRASKIKELCQRDSRIAYKKLKENAGIAANTNQGIALASGAYIGFADHDDTLSPYALYEVARAIDEHEEADIIYSDEDKLSDDGSTRLLPFFKPDWSPDLLLGVNYITHFLVVRKKLLRSVGNLRKGFDGSQDYELLLRLTEKTNNIVHIPKILYHWRQAEGSTSIAPGKKNYADSAGRRALKDAVSRRGIDAEVVELPERPTNYRLRYRLPKKLPKVSIIIPFKDKPELLKQCVDSIIKKTTYSNYEILLLSNNSQESETEILLKQYKLDKRCRIYYWNHAFNFSKINNFGASHAKGEYLVLLNNDTKVITPAWLEELIGVASQPGVGIVGPALLYPDKKNGIQHAGVVLGMGGMAGHVFRHRSFGEWTEFGLPDWPRNYLALTGACLVIAKNLYMKEDGLDEVFTVAGQDVAFGITVHNAGYKNIYWPFAQLYHYESVSVGTYNNGIQLDYDQSLKYYKKYHLSGDPYFNANLDLMNEQVGLRRSYEETSK